VTDAVVAGVDVGGSGTRAAVATLDGRIVGYGTGPGGNRQAVGPAGVRDAVGVALDGALAGAGTTRSALIAVHVGAAGVDFPSDRDEVTAALDLPATVENDALLGIYAGTTEGWGGAVVGGSGTNAVARAPDGRVLFVGGASWLSGDWGGTHMLGIEGIRLAIRSWEGREPPSALSEAIRRHAGAPSMEALYEAVGSFRGPDPAGVAPVVIATAEAGDPLAARLVRAFGREMGLSVGTALRRLGIADRHPEVVAFGGLFHMGRGRLLLGALRREVHRHAPGARVGVLDVAPVVGAVVAALRAVGADRPVLAGDLRDQWRRWAP
jgi:N-acetylglucosamine kinase-like BadF-type ATPase